MPLSDKIRAEVFRRDKAICAFSGKSLWLLDYGLTPFGQPDWADHVRPESRGGHSRAENLVCASYLMNWKKRANSSDNVYFFREGRPTDHYLYFSGSVSDEIASNIQRLSDLQDSDWYFNRALSHILIYLHAWYWDEKVTRDIGYWCKAALVKLNRWRRAGGSIQSLKSRGLIHSAKIPEMPLLLSLADAEDIRSITRIAKRAQRFYCANSDAFWEFIFAANPSSRRKVIERARRNPRVNPQVVAHMRQNARIFRDHEPIVTEV